MSTLTPEGRRLVEDLARRHGFGERAVAHMLEAVAAGRGRMAQFAHPEFGGSGQWMAGGMLMLGNLFDDALKSRVGALCADLSDALGPLGSSDAPAQSQSQGGTGSRALPETPFLTASGSGSGSGSWWPPELGTPSASGSQDSTRYAYFPDARRLAVKKDGDVRVHDTLDHRIGGFSQRQGAGSGFSMSSQHGTLDLASLPVVTDGPEGPDDDRSERSPSGPDAKPSTAESDATEHDATGPDAPELDATEHDAISMPRPDERAAQAGTLGSSAAPADDPIRLIERLGQLHERGLLTDEEFAAKKRELLERL